MEEAIYDESFRTLGEQARTLEGLRVRAGTVAAVANIATALLGGLALSSESQVTLRGPEWIAIGLFCVALAASLAILGPTREWVFLHHPHDLISVYLIPDRPPTLSVFRMSIAYHNGRNYVRNGARLRRLAALLLGASISLTAEVVVWLVILVR